MARLDFRGGAAKCNASGSISSSATSVVLTGDTSGWPTGASGRNFVAIIDRGVAGKMEKVLCSDLTAGTLTIATRGYDGTVAVAHDANCTVEHGLSASVLDDYGAHMYDDTRDDHSQYMLVDGTRPFTDLGSVADVPVAVGTANAEGTSDLLARADHVHDIADNAVGNAQLADDAVNTAEIADGAITQALMAAGLQVPIVCTSGTRPGSPTVGMCIYETDTGKTLYYHGPVVTWRPPWNTAWGEMAFADLDANVAHIQGTALSGLNLTNVDTIDNRKLKLEAFLTVNNSAAAGAVEVRLRTDGTQIHRFEIGTEDGTRTAQGAIPFSSDAGTHTFSVFTDVSVGAGDLTLIAAANRLSWFRLTDEGPDGLPS